MSDAVSGSRAAADLLRALANPLRLAIVLQLGEGRQCVHDLVDRLATPQPLVSQHLRVLRGARLISGTRRGREVVYQLSDGHVAHIARDAIAHTKEAQ